MTADARRLGPHAVSLELSAFPRIIRSAYAHQPLGLSSGPSRFSSASGAFRMLYAAQDFPTAFAEAVVRDRFVDRERRYLGRSTLEGRAVTLIGSSVRLKLLDIRGEAAYVLGVDTDAVRARGHQSGQVFSEWLHAETDFEGLLYDSRLTGRACVAIYGRALAKIVAAPARPLLAHAGLVPELRRLNITVRKP